MLAQLAMRDMKYLRNAQMGSYYSKPKLPNPFRTPGLEVKVMGTGLGLPELESRPHLSVAK